jgi:arsenate reductase
MGALPSDDDDILLLHNPRCSKSRATKELLEGEGVRFRERLYLEEPLSPDELAELAGRLGRPLAEWVRRKEAAFGEAGLGQGSSEAELAAAVAATPVLMERPIVIRGKRAAIGRPPEAILDLLR